MNKIAQNKKKFQLKIVETFLKIMICLKHLVLFLSELSEFSVEFINTTSGIY